MMDIFHFRKSQLNGAVRHMVLTKPGRWVLLQNLLWMGKGPISSRAVERAQAPHSPGYPASCSIH